MSNVEILELGADGSFDLSSKPLSAKKSAPRSEGKADPPSAPQILLEPNTFKILTDKDTGSHSALIRLGDGEYAKGVRVFDAFLVVETSERKLRIDLGPLDHITAVGKCTMWMPYMNIELK